MVAEEEESDGAALIVLALIIGAWVVLSQRKRWLENKPCRLLGGYRCVYETRCGIVCPFNRHLFGHSSVFFRGLLRGRLFEVKRRKLVRLKQSMYFVFIFFLIIIISNN